MKKLLLFSLFLLLSNPTFAEMPSNMTDRQYQSYTETSDGKTSLRVKLSSDSTIGSTKVTLNTASFDTLLSASDDTLQKALDTIDDNAISSESDPTVDTSAEIQAIIGANIYQAYDADLTTWAGITPGANVGTFLGTPSSANLLSAITDETGTGTAVFSNSPTFDDDITLHSAGVKLTGDGDGALTILGLGNGYDEDLTFNFDDVENTVGVTTSTGVTKINFGSINIDAGTVTASLTGNASGSSGSCTGNAATATKSTNLIGGNSTTLLGSIPYQSNTDTTTLLGPNTTTTKKFLRMTGDGTNGAAPAWDTLIAGDVPTLNQDTTGSAVYWKTSGTGKASLTGPGTGTTRAKTVRDADDTILELGGSYTPSGTWNWTSATATWPTFNQNTSGSSASCTGNAATVTNGIYTTSQVTALAAVTEAGDKDKYLHSNASTGALEFVAGSGGGDMVLADSQSVTGLKTFDKDKIAMKGTSTGVTTLSTANTSATSYTATFPAKDGTVAMTSDIPAVTYSKSFIITNPSSSADGAVWRTPSAITITAVHGVVVGGTNLVGHLTECDSDGLNPAGVDGATDMTITTSNTNDDGTLSNASIDAGDYVGWRTTSVSGVVGKAIITYDFTIN